MARVLVGVLRRRAKELRLEKDADALGIDVLVFSPRDVHWPARRADGYLYSRGRWTKTRCPLPGAVYNRIYTARDQAAARLEEVLGRKAVFNRVTWFDKWEVYSILRDSGVAPALPETMPFSPACAGQMLAKHGKVIIKPRRGQFGKDICRIEATDSGYSLFKDLSIPKLTEPDAKKLLAAAGPLFAEKPFILQQFIPFARHTGRIFDVRLYVQKDARGNWQVTGGFCRVAVAGSYITNQSSELVGIGEMLARGAIEDRQLKAMQRLGLAAAAALEKRLGHLGEVCVDFCVDTGGSVWIIEVNGHTQKKLLLRLGDPQLERIRYYFPLRYAQHLAIAKNAYPKQD
ncbi:MAG: hypothetical protein GX090_00310 [Firmicutes bacterium]|nr:hypothetical protein [Bacillota bacterium]HOB34604.1 YheC/YheD family protein [Bacillota bacterium]HPZ90739.1 YheC/YheD family protein [Bacillota bacterium]HQE02584.1 YheC/YheD family protein [Bacillota bacterium]